MIQTYRQPIIVQLTPLYGLERKAFYRTLIDNTEAQTTVISVTIKWYKDDIEVLDRERNILPYSKEIIADNQTLVDSTTGEIVMDAAQFHATFATVNEQGETIWHPDTPQTYMGESDFYTYIRDNVSIKLKDLITQAMLRAKDRGNL